MTQKRSARMRSDSVKNMSAYADQNHAPSLTYVRLEYGRVYGKIMIQSFMTRILCGLGEFDQ